MSKTEWPIEFLERREVELRGNSVYVIDNRGYGKLLSTNSSIVDARWIGDAVVITYANGSRTRHFGPYDSQRENF